MRPENYLWFAVACVVALAVFTLLNKGRLSHRNKNRVRGILFGAAMLYLTYDFYTKEKYMLMLVILAGSLGFGYMLFTNKEK